jgi:hypothetical protein
MQTASLRYLFLILTLLGGAGLYAVLGEPSTAGSPRWPEADSVYGVQPWAAGPLVVNSGTSQTGQISRVFRNPSGAVATFTMFSAQAPKLYGAGAEVPFLGNGYSVEPASGELVPANAHGVNGLIARRGTEQWLVLYAYGERRGLLGNGPLPWTLAILDGLAGHPNDYFKLYLATRLDEASSDAGRSVSNLAGTLFPRVASWYAA